MTKDKRRIQSCIDHINTAVDVDPWAKELVAEMGKEILEQLNNSNDCISRQDAIDARRYAFGNDEFSLEAAYHDCKLVFDGITDDDSFQEADTGLVLYYANEIIYALQEALEGKDTNVHSSCSESPNNSTLQLTCNQLATDCISRQQAIDVLTEYGNGRAVYIGVEEAVRRIEQLPSAQPEERTETHACDCISRQAAIDAARDWYKGSICGSFRGLEKWLQAVPSAQPERKTGHWERHNTYHGDDTSGFVDPDWRCSECGGQANVNAWFMYDLTDFCPSCGADMRGEQDDDNN